MPNIILSVTTYPARIWAVQYMLRSIYAQTMQPNKIVLYLSLEQFPNGMSDIPDELVELVNKEKLDIQFRPDDLGAHKKYYYAFREFPNDLIITVDEDLIYPVDMISTLYESWKKYPKAVHASRTHLIAYDGNEIIPYHEWPVEVDADYGKEQFQVYATTGAGTLYDPSLFKDYLYDTDAIKATYLRDDDMWMKANELISGIPVVTARRFTALNYVPNSQTNDMLFVLNTAEAKKQTITKISDWFDAQTGEKNVLCNILSHPPVGYCITELREYLAYFRRQRDFDLGTILSLRAECEKLCSRLQDVESQYNTISNSTCWKITKPLRLVLDYLKRSRRY